VNVNIHFIMDERMAWHSPEYGSLCLRCPVECVRSNTGCHGAGASCTHGPVSVHGKPTGP
jgi:hypothetical protein